MILRRVERSYGFMKITYPVISSGAEETAKGGSEYGSCADHQKGQGEDFMKIIFARCSLENIFDK
jgi:hypothetical protein